MAGIAEAAVRQVGDLLVGRRGDSSRNMKNTHGSSIDYATQTDIDAERLLRDTLACSGVPVHGEEENGADPLVGWCWVVDPIDGTLNWANNLPLCAVSVALCENGVPMVGVILTPGLRRRITIGIVGMGTWVDGERTTVTSVPAKESVVAYDGFRDPNKDIVKEIRSVVGRHRLIGSTATEMALCANGGFGAVVAPEAMFWDVAAGIALIRAAGGVAVDISGAQHKPGSGSVIAGAGHIVATIVEALGGDRSYADEEGKRSEDRRSVSQPVGHLDFMGPAQQQHHSHHEHRSDQDHHGQPEHRGQHVEQRRQGKQCNPDQMGDVRSHGQYRDGRRGSEHMHPCCGDSGTAQGFSNTDYFNGDSRINRSTMNGSRVDEHGCRWVGQDGSSN